MKTILRYGLIIVFINLLTINTYSQEEVLKETELVKEVFDKGALKKVIKAEDKRKKADQLIHEADKQYAEVEKYLGQAENASGSKKKSIKKKAQKLEKKAVKTKTKASYIYNKSNKVIFNIYKDHFKTVRDKLSGNEEKLENARNFENEAIEIFKKAESQRKKAEKIGDIVKAYKIFQGADENEKLAIETQLKAYALYLDWYPEKEENEVVEDYASNSDDFVDPNAEDTNTEVIDYTTEKTETNETTTETTEDNTTTIDQTPKVVYKVQIAASRVPLSLDKLREIYDSDEMINNEIEDGWYKYSVGRYSSYYDAKNKKDSMGVKDAFIIAYKDGVKVPISDVNPELVPD